MIVMKSFGGVYIHLTPTANDPSSRHQKLVAETWHIGYATTSPAVNNSLH